VTAAGSPLLAFRIFLRGRARSDLAQVYAVGIWGEIKRELAKPGGPRVDELKPAMDKPPYAAPSITSSGDGRYLLPPVA